MKPTIYLSLFLLLLGLISCQGEDDPDTPDTGSEIELGVSTQAIQFDAEGGSETISITSNTVWSISSSASWCTTSVESSRANASVTINANANWTESEKTATLILSASGVDNISISVSQAAYVPGPSEVSSIDPDNTGMSSNAVELASNMRVGWNLMNTMEAIGGETNWGNPKTTNAMIAAVKDAGFNAVRIPCSWDQYIDDEETYHIKTSWMNRVQEVVDYCIDNDLYVILNIHWDGGWMEENCTEDQQEEVTNKLELIWKQIAIRFRNYDEQLLFAGANEPNADDQTEADVLNAYMQTFVDVVRATGGRNAYRNLIIQSPYTDIDKAETYTTLPVDEVENRLFAEVHYYAPYQFCLMEEDADWGNIYYFWGAPYHLEDAAGRYPDWDCEEDYLTNQFGKMKTKFVDQGVPVILGEFGAIHCDLGSNTEWQQKHDESRAYFYETVAREAKNNGLVPFCWDNEIIDRSGNTVGDSLTYQGLIKGADEGVYPF